MRRIFFELETGEIGGKSLADHARESAARIADEVVVEMKPEPKAPEGSPRPNAMELW